jgi:hypothetical protein
MSSWSGSILLAGLVLMTGCDLIRMKDEGVKEAGVSPVVRVHDQYLYPNDLEGISPEGLSKEDSVARVEGYINSWIRKQLLIHEAAEKIQFNEADLERKILDYRYSLMGYEYQSYYVNENLDSEISQEEIAAYYEENKDNFLLKQNIIRCKYVKLSKNAPKPERVSRWIRSNKPEDQEELNSYCLSFASAYHLNDSAWIEFDEVIKNSPLAEIPNKVQFLRNNRFSETSDNEFLYYLRIEEYKISDNISPLEFVEDEIRNIILNKRKVQLAERLEDEVYEQAERQNDFEIYN